MRYKKIFANAILLFSLSLATFASLPQTYLELERLFAKETEPYASAHIEDLGTVWHLWNKYDDYYIDKGGIQISNNLTVPWADIVIGLWATDGQELIYWTTDEPWTWSNQSGTNGEDWVKLIGQTAWANNKIVADLEYYLNASSLYIEIDWKITNNWKAFANSSLIYRMRDITIDGNSEGDVAYVDILPDGVHHALPADFTYSGEFNSTFHSNRVWLYDSKFVELLWMNQYDKTGTFYNTTTRVKGDSTVDGANGIVDVEQFFGGLARSDYVASRFYWRDPGDGVSNEAMIAYGDTATGAVPKYRLWNGTDLGSESSIGSTSDIWYWVVLKSAPTRDEKMLVASDDEGDVYAWVWNGTDWGSAKTLGTGILRDATYRGFDVAYEQSSGDAMIVVGMNNMFKYWVWDGSSWVVDGTDSYLPVLGSGPEWLKLASKPNSDEISLIGRVWYSTAKVAGKIWNGTAWDNAQWLEETNITTEMEGHEIIAVEYEQSSGYAMFVWGADDEPTTDDSGINWRQWNGTGWEAEGTAFATGLDTYPPFYLTLKPRPNSDELMLTVVDDALDLNTVRWSGSAWDSPVEHDAAIETDQNRCADFEWENITDHSGHGVLAWSSGFDPLQTKHWDGTNWNTQFETDPYAALTDQEIHQLRRTSDSKIFVSMVDDASDLHIWKWVESDTGPNYGSWTYTGSGLGEIETDMSSETSYEAFMFSGDIHEEAVNVAPVVEELRLSTTSDDINITSINVYTYYDWEVNVTDDNQISDLVNVTIRIENNPGNNIGDDTPTYTESSEYWFRYVTSSDTWEWYDSSTWTTTSDWIDPASCSKPSGSATNGWFKFYVRLSKIATYSSQWEFSALVFDSGGENSTKKFTGITVNQYSEITIITTTHTWTNACVGETDLLIDEGAITVNVTVNFTFDLEARGNASYLVSSEGYQIGIGNITIHKDTLANSLSLTATWADIGGLTNLLAGKDLQYSFKLWLDIPSGTNAWVDYEYKCEVRVNASP